MPPLTGLVLAGGRGRRFGGNKLEAALGEVTLLDRAIESLRPLCVRVVVVGADEIADPAADAPGAHPERTRDAWIPDARPDRRGDLPTACSAGPRGGRSTGAGEGPLAGIVAGLEMAGTPLVAVVAGDLPFPSVDVLSRLAAAWNGEPAVVGDEGPTVTV